MSFQKKKHVPIMFIDYFGSIKNYKEIASNIKRMELPKNLHYPGKHNEYWYAKDCHPKVKLNKALAKLLGDKILKRK